MKYRMNKFFARAEYDSDVTIPIDININDPISSIVIGFEAKATQATMTAHPVACIKKIELVDGSDVLYSLDGYQAEAQDWFNNGGQFRANWNMALDGNGHSRYIGLNFGRYLWDKKLAFDPKQFTNPQLRIQLDIDGGGNDPTYNYVTCWANIFDGREPDLQGFLMSKDIKEYTMASSTHEYTEMPLDYPYRNLYFRAALAGTEPNQCITNIKLSEDQDKVIPFDAGAHEILRNILNTYPAVEETYFYALDTSNRYLYIAPSTRVTAIGAVWAAAAAIQNAAFYDGDGGRLKTIAKANASNTQIHVKGYAPHSTYEIPFGDKMDIDDWYDVTNLGSLKLDVEGAASSTGHISLQQMRPY